MFILILVLVLEQFLCLSFVDVAYCADATTCFARVMYDNVYLYREPVDESGFNNIYFELPRTYFVLLTEDSKTEFYKAEYYGVVGYVKKEAVKPIVGTPLNPYISNQHFRIFAELSRDLRTNPTTVSNQSSQVTYIPLMSRNLTYIGSVVGEQLIEGRTDVWFYCKYSADKEYVGYVYSDFCDEIDVKKFPLNTEEVVYTNTPFAQNDKTENPTSLPVKNKTTGIIVFVLSVPAVIFLIMLVKSSKIFSEKKVKTREIKDY